MSSLRSIVVILAMVTRHCIAIPTSSPTCSKSSQLATFDDLTAVPGIVNNPLPVPYHGLEYQAFSYANGVKYNSGTPGLVPHSAPNVGISNEVSQVTMGTPMLTTNYQGSPSGVTFNLKSFYYGCVLADENALTAVPVQCTVTITGYVGNDNTIANSKQVCAQTFQFNPTTMTGPQDLAFTGPINSACSGLNFVQVQYTLPGGLAAGNSDLGLSIDDVQYDLYTCK